MKVKISFKKNYLLYLLVGIIAMLYIQRKELYTYYNLYTAKEYAHIITAHRVNSLAKLSSIQQRSINRFELDVIWNSVRGTLGRCQPHMDS